MEPIKFITDIFLYIFEAWVFGFYANLISSPRKKTALRIFCIAIGYIALLIIYEWNNLIATGISIVVINAFLLSFLYKTNVKSALFHAFVLFGIMAASEAVTMAIVTLVANGGFDFSQVDPSTYVLDVIISKLVYFALLVMIASPFAKSKNKQFSIKAYWILLMVPLSGIVTVTLLRNVAITSELSFKSYVLWIVSAVLLLFSNIIVFVLFQTSQKNAADLSELKAIQLQSETDAKYLNILEQSNKDMQIFAHGMKNHLTQIRSAASFDDAKQYLDAIYPELEKFSSVGISQNKMLDLIISKYLRLCESKNIAFSVDVKTANLHYIADTDLSALLNNLLDNAVEAAEKSENRFVKLAVYSKNQLYDGLTVLNSCCTAPLTRGEQLETTKSDKKLHGIGIKSILKVVEKYNGIYDWNYNESTKTFETIIAFPNQK